MRQKARTALISVFDKEGLKPLVAELQKLGIEIFSTGGTERFIKNMGVPVTRVESLTTYPSILGGRVKTLHPKVFGGILSRRDNTSDVEEIEKYEIPQIDIVIVDLYPFEQTLAETNLENEIIEKVDIGGISLIRAAAKNYRDVLCVPSKQDYATFLDLLKEEKGESTLEQRKYFAARAFKTSAAYDRAISNYFNKESVLEIKYKQQLSLRYGENPHQKGTFYGPLDELFEKIQGKELSYNNLLDVDAAVNLISEFSPVSPTFAILKHNNACGLAVRPQLIEAWEAALQGDPVSAFGGILICNTTLDETTATQINKLFYEVLIAPDYTATALEILSQKKKRVVLRHKKTDLPGKLLRSCLNGSLVQDRDSVTDSADLIRTVTKQKPKTRQIEDLIFASKICKHTKSNCIVLAKNGQLLASGTGQTSRVDALKQAIKKATDFGLSLEGAVMASDAFFPFPDCVEIAYEAGIRTVIQPGGSIKDRLSIDFCDSKAMSMVFTGIRHFKH